MQTLGQSCGQAITLLNFPIIFSILVVILFMMLIYAGICELYAK